MAGIAAKPIPVVIDKVQVSDMPIVKAGLGTAVAYNVVNIHAQVTGTIQKILFGKGKRYIQAASLRSWTRGHFKRRWSRHKPICSATNPSRKC